MNIKNCVLILEILWSQLWTVKILSWCDHQEGVLAQITPIDSSIVTRRSSCQNVSIYSLDLITVRTRLKYRYSHTPSWHSNISKMKRWVIPAFTVGYVYPFSLCLHVCIESLSKRNIESYDPHLSKMVAACRVQQYRYARLLMWCMIYDIPM